MGVGREVGSAAAALLGEGVGIEADAMSPKPRVVSAAPATPTTSTVAPVIARRRRRRGRAARPIGRQPSSGSMMRRVLMNLASGAGRAVRRASANAAERCR